MIITKKQVKQLCGPVIALLFAERYPDGTTLEQLKVDEPQHNWIHIVIEAIENV